PLPSPVGVANHRQGQRHQGRRPQQRGRAREVGQAPSQDHAQDPGEQLMATTTAATTTTPSDRQAVRENEIKNIWKLPAPALHYGREQHRFRLIRKTRGLPAVDLDPFVESANWQRAGGERTAELNFRRPLTKNAANMMLTGDTVRCDVALHGSGSMWRPVWECEVATPSHQ